jgi:hypothetical protein
MNDLVKRLRNEAKLCSPAEVPVDLLDDAADRIERLEAALHKCAASMAALITPNAIATTSVAVAWANIVAAEALARTALAAAGSKT